MSIFRPFRNLLLLVVVGYVLPVSAASKDHLQVLVSVEDSRHLLMRTGLGAAPSDIVAMQGLSRGQAIERIVQGYSRRPEISMPDWVEQPVPLYHALPDMDNELRALFNNARDAELAQLRQWWVLNMLETTSPQTERMVLFWHDLFATNYHDLGKQSLAMARQNQTFRNLGFGSWEQLLKAMIRDAALLQFLNSGSNHKASPNENLARELMELFVLGEGNYDEATVREAARALTGHDTSRIHDLQFRLKTWAQDRNEKVLFGQRGHFDGDDLVELLLEQEAAPRFLVTRFWHAFISDSPPDAAWVDEQALQFRQSGMNIATLYANVLSSAEFWHADNRGAIIKSPVDIIIGTARTLDYPKSHWQQMPQWLRSIGMQLFAPPNVAGWKEGGGFITPGRLLNRYKVTRQMAASGVPQAQQTGEQAMLTDAQMQSSEGMQNSMEMHSGEGSMGMQGSVEIPVDEMVEVELRLAAEDYRGPAQFKLSLMLDENSLWQSTPRYFMAGRDTEAFGRIENMSDVSWQSVTESLPAEDLSKASAVRVYFLNDDASDDGDRNLYIDGLRISEAWLPASGGIQISGCPSQLRADSGKLYCNGYVELSLKDQAPSATSVKANDHADAQLLASAIHVGWGRHNRNNDKRTLEIFLDHLQTPSLSYHHVRFSLEKSVDQPILLQLDSYSCWPDCIEQWPECAWADEHFKAAKHVSFPWVNKRSNWWSAQHDHQCHYQALSNDEQQLVSSLWADLPQLLAQVSTTSRVRQAPDRWLPIIEFFEVEYDKGPESMDDTPFTQAVLPINIAAEHAPPEHIAQPLPVPHVQVNSFDQLITALENQGLQVHQLLLPEIATANVAALPKDEKRRSDRYLNSLLEYPLFQLK